MRSRPATLADLYAVDLQPAQQKSDPRPLIPDSATDADLQIMSARAVESDDGRVIACCGARPHLPGVAEAWALFSYEVLAHPKWLLREGRRWLDSVHRERGIRRIQATADEEHGAAHRFLAALGFEREGRMRAYGLNGENCWMYGRVR